MRIIVYATKKAMGLVEEKWTLELWEDFLKRLEQSLLDTVAARQQAASAQKSDKHALSFFHDELPGMHRHKHGTKKYLTTGADSADVLRTVAYFLYAVLNERPKFRKSGEIHTFAYKQINDINADRSRTISLFNQAYHKLSKNFPVRTTNGTWDVPPEFKRTVEQQAADLSVINAGKLLENVEKAAKHTVSILQDITFDVKAIVEAKALKIAKLNTKENVLTACFYPNIPNFPVPADNFIEFATSLKTFTTHACTLPEFDFSGVSQLHFPGVICASTSVRPVDDEIYTYAVVTQKERTLFNKIGILDMIAQGLACIKQPEQSINCSRQTYEATTNSFSVNQPQWSEGKPMTAKVLFTNTIDNLDIDAISELLHKDKSLGLDKVDLKLKNAEGKDVKEVNRDAAHAFTMLGLYYANQTLVTVDDNYAIIVDKFDSPRVVVINVNRVKGVLNQFNLGSECKYPVVAEEIKCPQHAMTLLFKMGDNGKTVMCHINDPNHSSIQQFEDATSDLEESARLRTPGGWCQTWSAFQTECEVLGSSIHKKLVAFACNSQQVQFGKGTPPVYATQDEDGIELAKLFAKDSHKPREIDVNIEGKLVHFCEWGCAFDFLVRCLAFRYCVFAVRTTSLEAKAIFCNKSFGNVFLK